MTPFCVPLLFFQITRRAHCISGQKDAPLLKRELLNVSRADIPYSCISARTSSGSSSPESGTASAPDTICRSSVNGTNFTPVIKSIPCAPGKLEEIHDTVHKIQTGPEGDSMLFS